MRTVHTPSFRMIRMTLLILAVICICILLGAGIGLVPVEQTLKDVPITTVSDVTLERSGQTETISLPYRITRLSPRETFQIDFTITPSDEDELYVKTVYAPLKVYADGELIYSYGTEGTYPTFFADPPTEVVSLSLPKGKHTLPVTMVYEAPNARHSMVIAAPLLGSDSAITRHLTSGLGLSLLFAAVQIFMGILLILITLLLFPMDMRFTAPLWLGLFALVTGIWTASESNLTLYYTHHPSLFYMLAFMALFSITIPLYHFTMELLHLTDSKVLQSICLLQEVSFAAALILQLTGLIPFSKSMYYFHLLLPLSVVFLAGYILYVGMCTRSITMKHFFFPVAILAVSSCMEVLNYQIRIINQLSSVFQIGILLFILFSELLAGRFLKDALMLREKNQILSANLDMLEKQTDMQKERVALLLQNEAMVKQQRHDLKHQYAILSSFCEEGDYASLQEYVKELLQNLPVSQATEYCHNTSVNAIVSYYISQAAAQRIETKLHLEIPEALPGLRDADLCVIFGNLLENALEACTGMTAEDGSRFIELSARVMGKALCITMDNSFNGQLHMENGELLSHKRHETGIGLMSIRSVAEKSGGNAEFKAEGRVFLSNVMVKL